MVNNTELINMLCDADMRSGNEQLQELAECVSVEEAERMQRIEGREK